LCLLALGQAEVELGALPVFVYGGVSAEVEVESRCVVWWEVVVGVMESTANRNVAASMVISGEWEDAARRHKSRCFLVQAEWLWL
jgi:hypothetical protein